MGLTADLDCCSSKFRYDLFILFTEKYKNSDIETVTEKTSAFHKIHRIIYAGEEKEIQQPKYSSSYDLTFF